MKINYIGPTLHKRTHLVCFDGTSASVAGFGRRWSPSVAGCVDFCNLLDRVGDDFLYRMVYNSCRQRALLYKKVNFSNLRFESESESELNFFTYLNNIFYKVIK